MTHSVRILTSAVIVSAFASCSPHKPEAASIPQGNPYGAASPAAQPAAPPQQAAAPAQPINPIYDTPAAYEDNGITPADPGAVTPAPATATPPATAAIAPAPAPAAPPANGAAIIYTVVKGDTLSGIAAKHKVPAASIKQANRMTNDTVILGKKMVIPPN